MNTSAIQFETYEVAAPPDPARMDVTAFVGFVTSRAGVTLQPAVRERLAQTYGDSGTVLLNRPVTVSSIAMFDALFDTNDRLAEVAEITGATLAETLPGSGVAPALTLIVDGVLHDLSLTPLPTTPAEALDRVNDSIAAAGLPVLAQLVPLGGAEVLRLTLNPRHGAGTLTVLPYPTLGFSTTQRAEARNLPSPMGLAVRQFFASGGTTAVIVAMGTPAPYDTPRQRRMAALLHLIYGAPRPDQASFAELTSVFERSDAVSPLEPAEWSGIQHMIGAEEVTFICLPDLPELVSPRPEGLPDLPALPAPTEAFTECLPDNLSINAEDAPRYPAPVLDDIGSVLWTQAVATILSTIGLELRDKLLIAALPRTQSGTPHPAVTQSAFLQVAEGWVLSRIGQGAPEGLIAPDAPLAGHLARMARQQGTFLSAAIQPVLGVRDIEPRAPSDQRSCRFSTDLRGILLSADVTTSADLAWVDAPVSRLMALLLREARALGHTLTFEPSGPTLWRNTRTALRGLLEAVYRTGALAGTGEGSSYDVACDRTTMSDADIESGRLIAELSFLPARPVERITVRLPITTGGATA